MSNSREIPERFKSECISSFSERLVSLILTGSYARNEQTPISDIDLWLIIKDLSPSDLKSVAEIIKSFDSSPEINPQCISDKEINFASFKNQFNPIQLYLDGIILHGSLPEPYPTKDEIRVYGDSIMAFVLMSARHYITINESEETLSKGKLRKWVLNPFMWSLRYKIYVETGKYPRTIDDLLSAKLNDPEKELVQVYSDLLKRKFKGSCIEVVMKAELAAKSNINS